MEATAGTSSVLLSELCDDLLRHIQSKPNVYKDQRNPPFWIGLIREKFGDRAAASIRRMKSQIGSIVSSGSCTSWAQVGAPTPSPTGLAAR